MKAVLQRVAGASVSVGGMVIARIGLGPGDFSEHGVGLVILLGVEIGDQLGRVVFPGSDEP